MGIEGRFPYDEFRAGQKELAQRIHDAAVGGQILIAEAMSGFGKTAAALAGALSAGEETGCKVVYTCRTKRQIQRVVDEVSNLQRRHKFRAAAMFSKFDYCLLRRGKDIPHQSFGWYCSFNVSNNLCTYFMNVSLVRNEFEHVVARALESTPMYTELMRESESIHICPYEVSKLALIQADFTVVPYHFVFDRKASHTLFGSESPARRKTIMVVDEAHNLRDFFRGMNSTTLTMGQLDGAIVEAKGMLMDDAAASLEKLQDSLRRMTSAHAGWLLDRAAVVEGLRDEHGEAWLQNLAFELGACSGAAWGSVAYDRRLPSLILQVSEFLVKLSSSPRGVLVKWDGTLGLVDPDPVGDLAAYLREFAGTILMSATVNPSTTFVRSLGITPSEAVTYEVAAEPFVTVRTVIDTRVSTRYKLRTPEMFARFSDRILSVIGDTDAGVGVFVPSYSILRTLHGTVAGNVKDRRILTELPGLSSHEASDIFDSFSSTSNSVLFAVQGGRFSEGEDFKGATMGAVIVVGLSLPPPSPMLYAEYAHMKRTGAQDSYLMLSRLPALRKAFQAAGRHIRNPGKKGLVFLMDDRFSSDGVVRLMPSWLSKDLVIGDFGPAGLAALTRQFWSSQD